MDEVHNGNEIDFMTRYGDWSINRFRRLVGDWKANLNRTYLDNFKLMYCNNDERKLNFLLR